MRFDLVESIDAMRAGRKSQTRRRSKYWLKKQRGDRITIMHQGEYLGWAEVRYFPYRQQLAAMTHFCAKAEGYQSLRHFFDAWWQLYPDCPGNEEVTVIVFNNLHWVAAK